MLEVPRSAWGFRGFVENNCPCTPALRLKIDLSMTGLNPHCSKRTGFFCCASPLDVENVEDDELLLLPRTLCFRPRGIHLEIALFREDAVDAIDDAIEKVMLGASEPREVENASGSEVSPRDGGRNSKESPGMVASA